MAYGTSDIPNEWNSGSGFYCLYLLALPNILLVLLFILPGDRMSNEQPMSGAESVSNYFLIDYIEYYSEVSFHISIVIIYWYRFYVYRHKIPIIIHLLKFYPYIYY